MQTEHYHLRVGEGRRIVLPTEVCRTLAVNIGDTLVIRRDENQFTVSSVDRTIQRFQELLAANVPAEVNLVDQLIAEREAAAGDE